MIREQEGFMKYTALLCLCAIAVGILPGAAAARDEYGAGMLIGSPTGISGKLWQGPRRAYDAAAGWDLGDESRFYVHADYLIQDPTTFVVSEGSMPWYYGIGGRLSAGEDGRLGVRAPIGVEYLLQDAPLNIFIEMAVVLDIVPETALDLNAGIGVRYRFDR